MNLTAIIGFLLLGVVLDQPPESKRIPVTETYHGVEVTEDYRWLEDGNDAEVQKWVEAQNDYTRRYLDNLPNIDRIRSRITQILGAAATSYSTSHVVCRGGRYFVLMWKPPKQQAFLVSMSSLDEPESASLIVDPNQLDVAGGTAIDWFVPSPDGSLVAVSMSRNGSELGDLHVYESATGQECYESIPRVNSGTAGGDVAWATDGTGLFYTHHQLDANRPPEDLNFYQQIYFHRFGSSVDDDRYELGNDFPRIAEVRFDMHPSTGMLLASVQNGDGGEFAHYLRSPDGDWRQFSRFDDGIVQAIFGPQRQLFVLSRDGAPRGKLLQLPANLDIDQAKELIPEGKDTIVSSFWGASTILATESRIYLVYQLGGPSQLRVFDLQGRLLDVPQLPDVSAASGLSSVDGDDVIFSVSSYVRPNRVCRFDASAGEVVKTSLENRSSVDLGNAEVRREQATSLDGTLIPYTLIMPRHLSPTGENPCLVTGYGGYSSNIEPSFSPLNRFLLENGFIIAVANLRGGAEFGEEWHQQGRLTQKQNVFDDFAAVLQHLVERKYTTPSKLAIIGASNGGLLMGATITQHPELMKAVVSRVGSYDMLRSELSPNGLFNTMEFGTVKNIDQFHALYAYSPYHHVKSGVSYPATLFLTGANDPRVDPMHSRKMTARLQSATASSAPMFLRSAAKTGHGSGTPLAARIEEMVDIYGFIFDRLDVEVQDFGSQ